jgi:hypothetical protein
MWRTGCEADVTHTLNEPVMSNRGERAAIAAETLQILDDGGYKVPGKWVSIASRREVFA